MLTFNQSSAMMEPTTTIRTITKQRGVSVMTKTSTSKTKGEDRMKMPKRLKKYRMDAGYTIYSLAEKLGVSFSTISYWENGEKFPRRQKLEDLEDLFKESYRVLFEDLSEEEAADLERRKRAEHK